MKSNSRKQEKKKRKEEKLRKVRSDWTAYGNEREFVCFNSNELFFFSIFLSFANTSKWILFFTLVLFSVKFRNSLLKYVIKTFDGKNFD